MNWIMKNDNEFELNQIDKQLMELALVEDLSFPFNDITTKTLFANLHTNQSGQAQAHIISKHKETIILCGLPVVKALLAKVDDQCQLESEYQDGDEILTNKTLLTLTGSAITLLMLERTLLNFLQRLSAIATLTAKYVNAIKHTHTKILDTRKTSPGFRHLEKYAVNCGGGVNHRMGLYDAVMIKDTHIAILGGIEFALNSLQENLTQTHPVIIEVRTLAELNVVIKKGLHKITRILLDNMSPSAMMECVQLCHGKVLTEASGNINLDNVLAVAETGVDFASIGTITHSAGCVDLSMKCDI